MFKSLARSIALLTVVFVMPLFFSAQNADSSIGFQFSPLGIYTANR